MNEDEQAYLDEIYNDCEQQEAGGVLTAYGAGQGDLCIDLLGKKRGPFRASMASSS